MQTRAIILLTFISAGWGPTLNAQEKGPCPNVYPNPQLGHYADLEYIDDEQGRVAIRFAVIGEQDVEGETHYWIEVLSAPPAIQGTLIAQMLVPSYPFDQEEIKEYIVQMPGAAPQRVPGELIQMMDASAAPGPSWEEKCAAADDLGIEEVTVQGQTYQARHFRIGGEDEGEVWIADVPFGLVKWVMAESQMELLGFGDDAKSSITGEPVDIQIPQRDRP